MRNQGESTVPCAGKTNSGLPCGNNEIEGLEYCLHHVPDELLEEAEEVAGFRRCRFNFGQPGACRYFAAAGTEPPACKDHGANAGSSTRKNGALRLVNGQANRRLNEIMSAEGEALLAAAAIEDPLDELLKLGGEVRAFKEILRLMVARMDIATWRYTNSKLGEQLRAEILLYERAIERYGSLLMGIAKLRIKEHRLAIDERMVQAIESALNTALQASGANLEGQAEARKVLRRELKAVS